MGNREILDELVRENLPLVKYIVRRFLGRGKEYDDLYQTGCIGLLKAIKGFDCAREVKFSTYAVPLIIGEIRRFLRDDQQIHISRSISEAAHKIRQYLHECEWENGCSPSIDEICSSCDLERDTAILALNTNYPVRYFSEPLGENESATLGERIPDERSVDFEEQITLHSMLSKLNPDEQQIIKFRFFDGKTQNNVGKLVGKTQVQISRAENRIFRKLRCMFDANATKYP